MKQFIKNILLGADIEIFLQNKLTGEYVSAEGLIKGTKDEPFNFDVSNKYFATSLDNVSAEFCIPPARNKEEFYANIAKSVGYINANLPKDLCTVAAPAVNFDEKWLQTEQAKLFGCEPDYNAYTRQVNIKPNCGDATLRSAGGHIHVGYDDSNEETNIRIIKAMDLFIGIPSVIQEPWSMRKELYGKAGAFRHKEYGVEYRTVSNYYLETETLTKWVYDATQSALAWLNEGNELESYLDRVIEDTINNCDKEVAVDLLNNFNIKLAA